MSQYDLSIIVPVKNETHTIFPFVKYLNLFLNLKKEIIFVIDNENDTSLKFIKNSQKTFDNIVFFINNKEGPKNAVNFATSKIRSNIFCIMCVDEIIPLMSLEKMFNKISIENFDFVSATRYKNGGKRYGGSTSGKLFSYLANYFFNIIKPTKLSDLTTGIKMMKKKVWESVSLESKGKSWAFAFELSLKVLKNKFKVSEEAIISVDRIYGGNSNFYFFYYFIEYLKWFFWGLRNV